MLSCFGYSQTLIKLKQLEKSAGAGSVIVTDNTGTPTYSTISSLGEWMLTGNALGNNTSFIGSTDNRSLQFWSNNIKGGDLDSLKNWRFYGPLSIGDGSSPIANTTLFRVNKNMGSATSYYALYLDPQAQSTNTVTAMYITTSANTASTAGTYTIPDIVHFNAAQGTFGSGSTVTNQWGFVWNGGTGASVINAGFRGRATANATRWNLYMDGSAQNYIAGSVGIATTTPSEKLHVIGAIRTSSTTNFLGGTTINSNGTTTETMPVASGTLANKSDITFVKTFGSISGTWAASSTYYDGMFVPNNSNRLQGTAKIYLFTDCTLVGYTITYYNNGVNVPAGTSTISVLANNSTASTLTTISGTVGTTNITGTMNVNYSSGDYLEIRSATPAFSVSLLTTAITVNLDFKAR